MKCTNLMCDQVRGRYISFFLKSILWVNLLFYFTLIIIIEFTVCMLTQNYKQRNYVSKELNVTSCKIEKLKQMTRMTAIFWVPIPIPITKITIHYVTC